MIETSTVGSDAIRPAGETLGAKRDRDLARASWAATLVVMGSFSLPLLFLMAVAGAAIPVGVDHDGVKFGVLALCLTPPLYWWWRRSAFRHGRRFGVGLSAAAGLATWICTPRALPWGASLAVAIFAFTAAVPFVAAFLLAPEPRDPDATNVLAERRALRLHRRSWSGAPKRPNAPVLNERELRGRRTTRAVMLVGVGLAFAVVPNLLASKDFFVVTRQAQVQIPDIGRGGASDDVGRSILDLVSTNGLWATAVALLVATPLFFWWWRRSRFAAGAFVGVALSAAACAVVAAAHWTTPLVVRGPLMWGLWPIIPGTERPLERSGTWWTLVVATVLFAAAFVVAPPPKERGT